VSRPEQGRGELRAFFPVDEIPGPTGLGGVLSEHGDGVDHVGQRLEGHHVNRLRRHGEAVSSRMRLDHVADSGLAQFGPQPGNQRLQRVTGVAWRVVGPDLPGQRASRHDTPGIQGKQREQNP